jgi:hypothetical protein
MIFIISVTEHKNFPKILGICHDKTSLINLLKDIDFKPFKEKYLKNPKSDKGCITICISKIEDNQPVNYDHFDIFWICGATPSDNMIFVENPTMIDKYIERLDSDDI